MAEVAAARARGAQGGIKKPHHYHPGTVALQEIHRFQKSTDLNCRLRKCTERNKLQNGLTENEVAAIKKKLKSYDIVTINKILFLKFLLCLCVCDCVCFVFVFVIACVLCL